MGTRGRGPAGGSILRAVGVGVTCVGLVLGAVVIPGGSATAEPPDLMPEPWQMLIDSDYPEEIEEPGDNGDPSHYGGASAPDSEDDWVDAPDPVSIGYHEESTLPPDGCDSDEDTPTLANYVYFQTFITVPESFTGPFAMTFSEVDDGARVEINPFQDQSFGDAALPANYVTADSRTTGDLSADLDLGEINRIVVTLVDDCRSEAILTGATFLTNDAVECEPGGTCTATVQGSDNRFTVTASGGNTPATLFAVPNGGPAPECGLPAGSDGELSPDWVQFGLEPATAGATWSKEVTITSLEALAAEDAEAAKDETQICFTAPYVFDTRPGYPALAGGPEGLADFYGFLPDCVDGGGGTPGGAPDSSYGPFGPYGPYEGFGPYGPFGPFGPFGSPGAGDPPPATPTPATDGPCVSEREVVQDGADYFTQITFRVPAGELDPQGRSCRRCR